jgi:subtilisin family serine protease
VFVETFDVPSDSVFGHPAVPGVIAVGAVPVNSPDMIEFFSSEGPASIFFPSFESRSKPDVVAPDGVSITGAGGFSNPFFGTSAAAPHVAGVVALMLQADPNLTSSQINNALTASSNPGFTNQSDTPDQVANALKNTAIDLGSPGFDNIYGFGRVNAFAAVEAVASQPTPTTQPSTSDSGGGSCSISAPAQFETVVANMLIPMIFGLAMVIRILRKKL